MCSSKKEVCLWHISPKVFVGRRTISLILSLADIEEPNFYQGIEEHFGIFPIIGGRRALHKVKQGLKLMAFTNPCSEIILENCNDLEEWKGTETL